MTSSQYCLYIIVSIILKIVYGAFNLPFEMNNENNQMFTTITIESIPHKMLVDTGSYITWIKCSSTKVIDCSSYSQCKSIIFEEMPKDIVNITIIKYETGIVALEGSQQNISLPFHNNSMTIEIIIGIALYIDIKTNQSIDGILGLGMNNSPIMSSSNDNPQYDMIIKIINLSDHYFAFDFESHLLFFELFNQSIIESKYRLIAYDDLSNLWEINVNHLYINSYDICEDMIRLYSKCSIAIDTGTQYYSFPLTLINKAIQAGRDTWSAIQVIIIQLINEDIITLDRNYWYKEANNKGLLKKQPDAVLFQSNTIDKIIFGINFLKKYQLLFDYYNKGLWIIKDKLIRNKYKNQRYTNTLNVMSKEWKLIT